MELIKITDVLHNQVCSRGGLLTNEGKLNFPDNFQQLSWIKLLFRGVRWSATMFVDVVGKALTLADFEYLNKFNNF